MLRTISEILFYPNFNPKLLIDVCVPVYVCTMYLCVCVLHVCVCGGQRIIRCLQVLSPYFLKQSLVLELSL